VRAKAGNNLVTEYLVAYDASSFTGRSRVRQIKECGSGDSCLGTTAIAWTETQSPGWTASATAYWPPNLFSIDGTGDGGSRLADLNGDGLADFIHRRWYSGGGSTGAWLNTGSGWVSAAGFFPPNLLSIDGTGDGGSRLVDLNGDGLVDFIHRRWYTGGGSTGAWLNTGSGWVSAPGYFPPNLLSIDGTGDGGSRLVDLNGDGLVDFIHRRWYTGGGSTGAWLNTGSGWSSAPAYFPPNLISIDGTGDGGSRLVDLNGDGLVDFIHRRYYSGGGSAGAWLNTGSGWASAPSYTPPYYISIDGNEDAGSRFEDLNGDGLVDFVYYRHYGNGVNSGAYLNTGEGWISAPAYELPAYISADPIGDAGARFADLNGDGLVDFLYYRHYGSGVLAGAHFNTGTGWTSAPGYAPPYYISIDSVGDAGARLEDLNGDGLVDFIYRRYYSGGGQGGAHFNQGVHESVSSITNGVGAQIALSVKPLTDAAVYTKDSGAAAASYPSYDVQRPIHVVASVEMSDGRGATAVSSYKYGGLKGTYDGRGVLGFRWAETSDQTTGLKARTEYRQDWPYVGLPSLVKKTQSSGALLSEASNSYGCVNPATGAACTVASGNRYFPFASQGVETGNDLNGAALPTVTTSTQYDGFGNATLVTVSTGGGHSKSTSNVFVNDVPNWLLGRLKASTVQSAAP
jgi:hypothetical protein